MTTNASPNFRAQRAAEQTATLGRIRKRWLGPLWLIVLPLSLAAAEHLVTSSRAGVPGSTPGMGWYFRSGQWRADARTVKAAFQFLVDDDREATGALEVRSN
jgi:hypothetical protein